jgi:hypothetical protein
MENINDFIERNRITMKIQKTFHNPWMESDSKMNHYECIFEYKAGTANHKTLLTYFSMGLGLHGKPKIDQVLDCLASDASGYENARDFEDWCNEYGYDTDSRKAEKTYHIIAEQAKKLEKFLGEDEYKKLLWETERK